MKQILLLAIVTSTIVNAGLYTSLTGLTMKSQKADSEWALDVVGEDVRVYEYTTKTKPKMKCVIILSESKYKAPVQNCIKIK